MPDHKHDSARTKIIRQTVTLSFVLNGDGTGDEKGVDRQLNILADADEVIVRQIPATGTESGTNIMIQCVSFGDKGLIGVISGRDFIDVSPNSTSQ